MIANHTSMAQLFGHTVSQFDKLFKRNAFLDQYRKEPMFQEGLEEFNSARCVPWACRVVWICCACRVV
jgi:tubulin gamma